MFRPTAILSPRAVGCIAFALAVLVIAATTLIDINGRRPRVLNPKALSATCRVELDGEDRHVEVVINNSSGLLAAIVDQIERASPELNPAAYVSTGQLVVAYADGTSREYELYAPWGHFSHKGSYYQTDLSGLQDAVERGVADAAETLNQWDSIPSP